MPKAKPDSYNRAKIEILNYILTFFTCKSYHTVISPDKDRVFKSDLSEPAPVGTLVILTSAPFTKYYLSWLVEIKKDDNQFYTQYLLKTIEDGSLCWWRNVGFDYLPLDTIEKFPQWKWSDKQFEFWERWKRACDRCDAYITLPCMPEFGDDGSVTLSTRERYGLSDYRAEQKFDNWKTMKLKDMMAFYKSAVANKSKKEINETTD